MVAGAARLLEREAEMASLDAAYARAAAGDGGVVAIEAAAGLGKSRLLAAAGGAARRAGFRVLVGRGSELEAELAFGVVRQLFEASVEPDLFVGAAAQAQRLFAAPAGAAPVEDTGFSSLHGLHWLTVNLADAGPLALVIDDAQWADPPSQRFLDYLGRRLDGLPVLVVMTGLPGTPWPSSAAVLRPQPLGADAVAELVSERLDDPAPEFATACLAATGGNPLFLRELLAEAAAAGVEPTVAAAAEVTSVGPPAVARFVLHRVAQLGATELARAVAVLGSAEPRIAARVAGLGEDAVRTTADQLVRAEILAPIDRLEFAHPIVGAAIYEDLAPGERLARHAAAAAVLDEAGAGPEAIAAHLLLAAPAGDVARVAVLRAAAESAARRGAPEAAVPYLRRALDEPPPEDERAALLCRLGRWELVAQRFADARRELRTALETPGPAEVHAEAARWLARCALIAQSGAEEAGAALERMIGASDDTAAGDGLIAGGDATLALEAELALLSLTVAGPAADLGRLRRRATGAYAALADVLDAHLEVLRGAAAAPAAALTEDALARGLPPEGAFMYLALRTLRLAERYESAERRLAAALELARALGLAPYIGAIHAERALIALARGAVADAVVEAETGLAAAGDRHVAVPLLVSAAIGAELERGDLDAAAAHAARVASADTASDRAFVAEFVISRGRLRIAQGDVRGGLEDLLAVGERLRAHGIAAFAWRAHTAAALAQLDEHERARELAREQLTLARTVGTPHALGLALRTMGSVDESIEMLEEAVAVLAPSPARLEHAHALADLGALLVRRRRRREAREALRQALELAVACGATTLADRVHGDLGAGGGRRARLELTGIAALTPAERRVCELAAGDLTNRQIAQTLFVTEKTVELHLTSAYRKLDIRSRFQLEAALRT